MKPRTIPVKRQPVQKGLFKRLNAVTRNQRRQRVAAAAADIDDEESNSKIARSLFIIFLFHVLAIGLWFVHKRFLDDNGSVASTAPEVSAAAGPAPETNAPVLSSGVRLYKVKAGENYRSIAAAQSVLESDLREVNDNRELGAGTVLKLPPKRIIAADPPELVELQENEQAARDAGLVDAIPVDAPAAPSSRAVLVRPNLPPGSAGPAAGSRASGERYEVKSGDSVWRIANRFGVDQDALMKANGISDPRRLKVGMTLTIPR